MSLVRSRGPLAAGVLSLLLAGIALADTSGATTPQDTVEDTSVAMTTDGVAATSAATTPADMADTSVVMTAETVVNSPGDSVPDTATDGGGMQVLAPDELWAGVSRGEWDARWWQWAVSMPEDVNPNFDPTGERCGYGQSGPVFFVPGNFGSEPVEITCVVAEGTAIYMSAGGVECSTVELPPFFGRDEDELGACATSALDEVLIDAEVRVDGHDVTDLEAYRTTSPLFTMTFADDNFFGVEPGVAQAVAEGYGLIIAPPPPGEYEITGSATFAGDPEPVTASITIVVEAAQVIEPPASSEPGSTPPVESPAVASTAMVEPTSAAAETTTP